MINLATLAKCSGCAACEQICVAGAIVMKENPEGFLLPVINSEKCISCRKCEKTCPVINPFENAESQKFYAARAKDEDVVLRSSSGGMFSVFARRVLSQGGVVFGAGYDENIKLVHKSASTVDELTSLMGSKYIQSDVQDTYKAAKTELERGRQVLFSGTPCQCAGFRKFLGKEFSNLILVDFVCHGVPSPKLFAKYLEFMSKDKEIESVRFRDKTENVKTGHQISITYKDASVYRKPVTEDLYMRAFIENISLRESCYDCSFKNFNSSSDITIGDFWGLDKTDSPLKDKNGVSLVILNTPKGEEIFASVQDSTDTDLRNMEEAVRENKSMVTSTRRNPLRHKYLRSMNKTSIDKLNKKYCGNSFGAKLRRLIAR